MKQIYIIESNGNIKIGVSEDVKRRIKQFKIGNPSEIKLIYLSEPISNCFEIENKLHKKFNEYSIGNEWFSVNKEKAIKYLERIKEEFKYDKEKEHEVNESIIDFMLGINRKKIIL